MWLFFAFVAVPIIEIALFIQLGGAIGVWATLGIVILTGEVTVRYSTDSPLYDIVQSGADRMEPSAGLPGFTVLFGIDTMKGH